MKNLILTFAMFSFVTSFAQKVTSGSLTPLRNEVKINFEVDYSEAVIHGMSETDFADYEQDWFKDKAEIISYVVDGVQDRIGDDYIIGQLPDAKYTILFLPQKIDRKGNTLANAKVMDKQGNVVCEIMQIKGEGGTFGTKLNLIKDGSKDIGKNFGKFLAKSFRKIK